MQPLASLQHTRCIQSRLPSKKTIAIFVLIEMEPILKTIDRVVHDSTAL